MSVITAVPGDNINDKVNALANGDTLLIADGAYNVAPISISGRSGITIAAQNVSTVTVGAGPWASGPKVALNGAARWLLKFANAGGCGVHGITLNGGGLRLETAANFSASDLIAQNGPYGGIETDTPGSPNGPGRANGLNLLRVAAQGNGCTGFNFSSYRGIRGSYLYSFGNNPGLPNQPQGWPSSFFRHSDGKWYAVVQDSGGAGKWCLLDDCIVDHWWSENNVGLGFWPDVYNQGITLRHSRIGPNRFVQNNYDAWAQVEISFGPTIIEDCLFANMLNIAESANVTVRACHFLRDGVITRNGDARGGPGLHDCNVSGNFLYDGATVRSPSGIPGWVAANNQTMTGAPNWSFDGGVVDPPPPPDDIITNTSVSRTFSIPVSVNAGPAKSFDYAATVPLRITTSRTGIVKRVEAV